MAQEKKPKATVNVKISKTPKTAASPEQFNSYNISWQLHKVDNDGPWGLRNLLIQKFASNNELWEELDSSGISSDLYDNLTKLEGKEFNSIVDLINTLEKECNGKINASLQREAINSLSENIFWTEVMPKLVHFENQDWNTLVREVYGPNKKTKHHNIQISKIIPEAQKRLKELKYDDIDELFSVRLTGKIRLWGFRKFNYFQLLWVDLNHEICPSSRN
jgi:hypothetical protein